MKVLKLVIAAQIMLALIAPSSALADMSASHISGGCRLSKVDSWTKVELTKERVNLTVGPTRCSVEGTYWLKNKGPATKLDVGFPYDFRFANELKGLTVLVDGKPIKFSEGIDLEDKRKQLQAKAMEEAKKRGGVFATSNYGPSMAIWKTWCMSFAPRQSHLVSVRYYTIPLKTDNDPSIIEPNLAEYGDPVSQADATKVVLASGSEYTVEYNLFSLSLWQEGPFDGQVKADCKQLAGWKIKSCEDDSHDKARGIYKWILKEPDGLGNISIAFRPPAKTKAERAKILLGVGLRQSKRPEICYNIAEQLDQLGKQSEAAQVRAAVLRTWKPSDAKQLITSEYNTNSVTAPFELDKTFRMASSLLQYYDKTGSKAASNSAKQVAAIYKADATLLQKESDRTLDDTDYYKGFQYDDAMKELAKVRAMCAKYGIDLKDATTAK